MHPPTHPHLPSAITLPHKEGAPEYARPGQFAARLGIEYDPVFVDGTRERPLDFMVPALSLSGVIPADRLNDRRSLLNTLDGAHRFAESSASNRDYTTYQRKAFTLLGSRQTKAAFDLVEAGVPFVTVFWKGDKELRPSGQTPLHTGLHTACRPSSPTSTRPCRKSQSSQVAAGANNRFIALRVTPPR